MKKIVISLLVLGFVGSVLATSFTDTDKAKNHGKTGLKNLTSEIDANFALIEAGTESVTLDAGYVYVGSATSQKVAVAVSGDVTMATNGVVAIASGVIVNADIKSDAAIASTKLASDVVYAGDATPSQLLQSGTIAGDAETAKTGTFNTVYSVAPVVVCNFAADPGDVQPLYVSATTTSNFTVTVATTNIAVNWIAIGQE